MDLMNPTECTGCGVMTPGTEPHAARCPIAPPTEVATPAREPAARAKPLNALTLAALPLAVATLQDQVEYLNDPLLVPGLAKELHARWTKQRADLQRSIEWIQSKIDTAGGEG